jgi:hypothetical protein
MRTGLALLISTTMVVGGLAGAQVHRPVAPSASHQAVERALPLLQESAITWTRVAKCFSCHHQGLGPLAVVVARERGFRVDEAKFAAQVMAIRTQLAPPEVSVSIGTNVKSPRHHIRAGCSRRRRRATRRSDRSGDLQDPCQPTRLRPLDALPSAAAARREFHLSNGLDDSSLAPLYTAFS